MITSQFAGQIDQFAIHLADDRRLGQSSADGFGELINGGAIRHFSYA